MPSLPLTHTDDNFHSKPALIAPSASPHIINNKKASTPIESGVLAFLYVREIKRETINNRHSRPPAFPVVARERTAHPTVQ